MRIGLFLAYWPWYSPEEQIELAKQADREGLDSVWVSEAWGQDAATVLGHLSALTERIGLGSGLFQIPARTPAMTAMTAATLDTLSNGRFRLGLGVSGPQVSEGWHGVSFARPVSRTREYVEIVRAALAREGALEYEGREFTLPAEGTGLGKPLKMLIHPPRADIPIYLGAIGPKAVEQTAEIADGWIPFFFNPDQAEEMLAPVRSPAATSTCRPPCWCAWTRTWPRRATWRGRGWRSTWAAWARRARTSTWRPPSGWATATPPRRSRSCSWPVTGRARAPPSATRSSTAARSAAARPTSTTAWRRSSAPGADTLLAMPFGDRPRIVEALAAAARGAAA